MIRTLNIPMTQKDFQRISKAKKLHKCKTWIEYLMLPVGSVEEQQ